LVKAKGLDRAGEVKLVRRKQNKKKGSRKEIETMDILHSLGFTCTKAGGSFGRWDVVAIDEERVLLIQVKSNRWPAQFELKRLMEGAVPEFCARLIFRFDDRRPLKVGTMVVEGDGRVKVYELADSAYTQAQEAKRLTQREQYHKGKARTNHSIGGSADGTETEPSGDVPTNAGPAEGRA
jgi:hypothetical protein